MSRNRLGAQVLLALVAVFELIPPTASANAGGVGMLAIEGRPAEVYFRQGYATTAQVPVKVVLDRTIVDHCHGETFAQFSINETVSISVYALESLLVRVMNPRSR